MGLTAGCQYGTVLSSKTITFTGAAGLGAVGNLPIFTTTGTVLVEKISAVSILTPVGATATLSLGVVGQLAQFIAATVGTTITTALLWLTNAPTLGALALPAALKDTVINANIVGTVAVAALTGGTLRFDVLWRPLSPDGNLT